MRAISYVCRYTTRRIIKTDERIIGEISIIVIETLVIRNALKQAIQENYPKVIVESDSLIFR